MDGTGGEKMRMVLALSWLLAGAASAENWPQWRGAFGTGVSTEKGLPTDWSRDRNIAWRTELGRTRRLLPGGLGRPGLRDLPDRCGRVAAGNPSNVRAGWQSGGS